MDKTRIGIQFNFDLPDKEITIKQTSLLTAFDMKSDGAHIDTYFTRKELKRFDPSKVASEKVDRMRSLIKKYVSYSSYTKIYTFIEVDRLSNIKDVLLATDFKDRRMKIASINKKSLMSNLEINITHPTAIRFLNKKPVLKIMNMLFEEVANRAYATAQEMVIEVTYEEKEEYNLDTDVIEISLQLEIIA